MARFFRWVQLICALLAFVYLILSIWFPSTLNSAVLLLILWVVLFGISKRLDR